MPTIRVVLRQTDIDGKIITKRYQNATAHVHPTTNMLQVSRRHGPSEDDGEILAEFFTQYVPLLGIERIMLLGTTELRRLLRVDTSLSGPCRVILCGQPGTPGRAGR